jgi:heme/copper-type cytochrome/quinol oxidase subunit 2
MVVLISPTIASEQMSKAMIGIFTAEIIIFLILIFFVIKYLLKKKEQEPPSEEKAREVIEKE